MQTDLIHYQYLGALVLQQFGIVIHAQADNNNLRTDVVGLGIFTHPGDESPPVWQHGIDLDTARIISIKLVGTQLNKIPLKMIVRDGCGPLSLFVLTKC